MANSDQGRRCKIIITCDWGKDILEKVKRVSRFGTSTPDDRVEL